MRLTGDMIPDRDRQKWRAYDARAMKFIPNVMWADDVTNEYCVIGAAGMLTVLSVAVVKIVAQFHLVIINPIQDTFNPAEFSDFEFDLSRRMAQLFGKYPGAQQ